MLSADRRAVLAAAVGPVGRGLPWLTAAGILGLAWLPLVVTWARGGTDLAAGVAFAAVVGSGLFALAVDDPASELTAAVPVPLGQRRGLRLALLVAVHAAAAAAILVVAVRRDPTLWSSLGERVPEVVATAAIAVACASFADAGRVGSAALTGAAAGPLLVGLVSMLAMRLAWLPAVAQSQHHDWWWWVAATAVGAVAMGWRDPAARMLLRWRG